MTGCKEEKSLRLIEPVDFSHVKISDAFWAPRLHSHATTTLAVCIDQIENKTGRIRNFENAAKGEGKHSGIYFDDSDVYKALEGIAYSLVNNPDAALERKADEWIDKFAAAQQPDGYINTFYTLTGLDKRWHNMEKHEMYCAGHMFEAAVAYYQATGKRKLLDVSERMADHCMSIFGPGKRHWVPGHEEIELALVKLYNVTGKRKYLDFANWLLEERGHGHGSKGDEGQWNSAYYQDDKPVREMTDIAGHAVRAMYLYCGMSDVAALKRDTGYITAMNRLWDDVVLRNMYVTGGIGSSRHNEGFTTDYDLPNYDAYCETCASIGMVFWNSRMNYFTGDAKYVDVLERSMYNGALAGISLKGDMFFYVNPLASHGTHHRQAWYGCACCPSQVSRFLPSIGNYIYGVSDNALWINLFIGNTASFAIGNNTVKLTQTTNYPWDGTVKLTVNELKKPYKGEIRLRIPDWCRQNTITVNGEALKPTVEKGYAVIKREWKAGDDIVLTLDMPVEVISADPRVKENEGKRAIRRGALVYCAEQVDNKAFDKTVLQPDTKFTAAFEPTLLNGVVTIKASTPDSEPITLIPYYAWDNRDAGEMKVWLDYR
ncbi:MAG: glycoside hydrolase family 127 protein [Tannerella sp.]|nr:glycoside hydrolase family 127 protein [Tannerella sp.]